MPSACSNARIHSHLLMHMQGQGACTHSNTRILFITLSFWGPFPSRITFKRITVGVNFFHANAFTQSHTRLSVHKPISIYTSSTISPCITASMLSTPADWLTKIRQGMKKREAIWMRLRSVYQYQLTLSRFPNNVHS